MAPGVAAASAGGERCCASELEREELAGLTAPRQWYCLVRVETSCDGASEGAFTAATEEDAETLAGLLTPQQALAARSPALCVEEADSPEQSGSTSRPASAAKPGGPCDHCGTSESPQWRRGPPSKVMLCNACGTRFRRTGNLGAAGARLATPVSSPSPASKLRVAPEAPEARKKARMADECLVYALPLRV